jgi:hypothetical protein
MVKFLINYEFGNSPLFYTIPVLHVAHVWFGCTSILLHVTYVNEKTIVTSF